MASASPPSRLRAESPGLAGWVFAIAISWVTLSLEMGLATVLVNPLTVGVAIVWVLVISFVPAAIVGSIGAVLVQIATLRATSHWPAVLLTSVIGAVLTLLLFRSPSLWPLALIVGVDAGIGRLAVIPYSQRRARRLGLR